VSGGRAKWDEFILQALFAHSTSACTSDAARATDASPAAAAAAVPV